MGQQRVSVWASAFPPIKVRDVSAPKPRNRDESPARQETLPGSEEPFPALSLDGHRKPNSSKGGKLSGDTSASERFCSADRYFPRPISIPSRTAVAGRSLEAR